MDFLFFVLLALSVVAATVPMFAFLGIVWWFDRYDREPIWLIGLTFVWGAFGAILLSLVGEGIVDAILNAILHRRHIAAITPVVVAPLIEEPTKLLILFLVARSRHFDNTTDGFVYGAAAGLGFGMTENFVYFAQVGSTSDVAAWLGTVVIRTFYSAVMHGTATSIVGASIGFSRFRGCITALVVIPTGIALAMGIHALWNGLITADMFSGSGVFTLVNLVAFPLEFLAVFVVFQFCLWDERRTIGRELREEASAGVLPERHVPVLSSFVRRNRKAWLEHGIPRAAYVRAATTLAFRKHQERNTHGSKRQFYTREVERLRNEITQLLSRRAA